MSHPLKFTPRRSKSEIAAAQAAEERRERGAVIASYVRRQHSVIIWAATGSIEPDCFGFTPYRPDLDNALVPVGHHAHLARTVEAEFYSQPGARAVAVWSTGVGNYAVRAVA